MSGSIESFLTQNHGRIRLLEAHDRNSTEAIRNGVGKDGQSFHGVWISGLTQTTYLGIPDTELISPLQRASLIPSNINPQGKNCRPLCGAYDADSGGDIADIPELVAILANRDIRMIIIEDKAVLEPGKKVNSLGDTSGLQGLAEPHEFAKTIRAFKAASAHKKMTITARIESFTVRSAKKDKAEEEASVQATLHDALARAEIYTKAGADAIMIHSKSKRPDEVVSFMTAFRTKDRATPLVVVPTTYSETPEDVLYDAGANVIIYANHLMRAKIKAVDEFSRKLLTEKPGLFSPHAELNVCVQAQNFGCLLQKLTARMAVLDEDTEWYFLNAGKQARERMNVVVKCLLDGRMAGKADTHIIPVKDLLKINGRHVSYIDERKPSPRL